MIETISNSVGVVVKIGKNVHRTLPSNHEFIHNLLVYFNAKIPGTAPQLVGVDKQGREILKFIPGDVPPSETQRYSSTWTVSSLQSAFEMIRKFHDCAAESDLRGDQETVIHGDLTPRNTVYLGEKPIAFIDWDLARPGTRAEDLGTAFWRFLSLGSPGHDDVDSQGNVLTRCCHAYGLQDRSEIVDWIDQAQKLAIEWAVSRSTTANSPYARLVYNDLLAASKRDNRWLHNNAVRLNSLINNRSFWDRV